MPVCANVCVLVWYMCMCVCGGIHAYVTMGKQEDGISFPILSLTVDSLGQDLSLTLQLSFYRQARSQETVREKRGALGNAEASTTVPNCVKSEILSFEWYILMTLVWDANGF